MRITFMIRDIWGLGGTIKATLNAAAALADRGHEVTIASCVRSRDEAAFEPDPRVRVVNLVDARKGSERRMPLDRWRARRPSAMDEHGVNATGASSALIDHRAARYLGRLDADVVIGTHPAINLYIARHAHPSALRVGQEHSFFDQHKQPVQKVIQSEYDGLHAIVCATEADVRAYREALPDFAGPIECLPNVVPPVRTEAESEQVVMAAGRLVPGKDFATLIRAFSRTVDRHRQWRLRIYGRGTEEKELAQLIEDTRSEGRVELMGPVVPLDAEWGRAQIAVLPSLHESFGLTLAEAMSAGKPVVAAAAPNGLVELVEPEVDGLLFEPKDVEALTAALDRLMSEPQLRRKLSEGAKAKARRWEPETVAAGYEALFDRLD